MLAYNNNNNIDNYRKLSLSTTSNITTTYGTLVRQALVQFFVSSEILRRSCHFTTDITLPFKLLVVCVPAIASIALIENCQLTDTETHYFLQNFCNIDTIQQCCTILQYSALMQYFYVWNIHIANIFDILFGGNRECNTESA